MEQVRPWLGSMLPLSIKIGRFRERAPARVFIVGINEGSICPCAADKPCAVRAVATVPEDLVVVERALVTPTDIRCILRRSERQNQPLTHRGVAADWHERRYRGRHVPGVVDGGQIAVQGSTVHALYICGSARKVNKEKTRPPDNTVRADRCSRA